MTVILVDPRRPAMVPIEAVEHLGGDVQYTEDMPIRVQWSLPAARSSLMPPSASVLLSSDPDHPEVRDRLAAGEELITFTARPGSASSTRLRSWTGCAPRGRGERADP